MAQEQEKTQQLQDMVQTTDENSATMRKRVVYPEKKKTDQTANENKDDPKYTIQSITNETSLESSDKATDNPIAENTNIRICKVDNNTIADPKVEVQNIKFQIEDDNNDCYSPPPSKRAKVITAANGTTAEPLKPFPSPKVAVAPPISNKKSPTVQNTTKTKATSEIPLIDVCSTLSQQLHKPVTRIEVKWDIIPEDECTTLQQQESKKESRWWAANVIPHDDNSYHILRPDPDDEDEDVDEQTATAVKVPIRILDYDPYPEGGFLEREISNVVFLNEHSIMDLDTSQSLWFRVEGSNWEEGMPDTTTTNEIHAALHPNTSSSTASSGGNPLNQTVIPLSTGEEGLRSILDTVLATAMQKSGVQSKMNQMTAAQQCFMADRIVKAKERMLRKLMQTNREQGVEEITPEHVRMCMEEIGTEGGL